MSVVIPKGIQKIIKEKEIRLGKVLVIEKVENTKDEVDYTKRAAGSIAGHTVYDRNIMVEPVIIKDYYTKDGAIENDAMGYVLPDQPKQ